eukprot:scaffold218778_cov31-Tisochrysis_lutea.AAC.1
MFVILWNGPSWRRGARKKYPLSERPDFASRTVGKNERGVASLGAASALVGLNRSRASSITTMASASTAERRPIELASASTPMHQLA